MSDNLDTDDEEGGAGNTLPVLNKDSDKEPEETVIDNGVLHYLSLHIENLTHRLNSR